MSHSIHFKYMVLANYFFLIDVVNIVMGFSSWGKFGLFLHLYCIAFVLCCIHHKFITNSSTSVDFLVIFLILCK